MRTCFIVVLLSGAVQAYAQHYPTDPELTGYKHTLNYPDHKIVFTAQPSNLILKKVSSGKTYYWVANREIKMTQGGYNGKLLHGSYADYYPNNNLKEQGVFKMGLKEGSWKNWTETGVLISETQYKNGVAEGDFVRYDANGLRKETGRYKGGKIDGAFRKYLRPDSVVVVKYKNGVPHNGKNWLKTLLAKSAKSKPES